MDYDNILRVLQNKRESSLFFKKKKKEVYKRKNSKSITSVYVNVNLLFNMCVCV